MPASIIYKLDSLPEPEDRFTLGECISSGVLASVYEATDSTMSNKKVALKIQKLTADNEISIQEEYKVLKDFSDHPNLPDFYGGFRYENKEGGVEIWFAMEFCERGSVMDLVRTLNIKNRRMAEEHIAFIIKEVTKALIHLHSHNIIHRSVSGDNILLTKDGEVKLVDFGLARALSGVLGKRSTCIGAAWWMAPEVVQAESGGNYGNRADVWALGITAIELGDGKPPLSTMHPTRVMFQIVRNPPPGLYRPGSWTEPYNDFVSECLEKNPEYRPYMEEVIDHPFLTSIPDNCHYLTQELKKVLEDVSNEERPKRELLPIVRNNMLQLSADSDPIRMLVEDLAGIENTYEEVFLDELKARFAHGFFHSFVGDILLVLNPNEFHDIYNNVYHSKYTLKSRSSNPPHIFSIADRSYQDAMHQEVPQHILLSGESGSGKSTSLRHMVKHLIHLGDTVGTGRGEHLQRSLDVVQAFIHAGTESNIDSTRAVLNIKVGYASSGKISTGKINVWMLEKCRVSSPDLHQSNFHILYYFYDAMHANGELNKYSLDDDRKYSYLRIPPKEDTNSDEIHNNPSSNIQKFETIVEHLKFFGVSQEDLELIYRTLAAILNLGEIRFSNNEEGTSEIENAEACTKVIELLNVDEKKFIWALTNYCLIDQGTAIRRKNNCNQAKDARDMLANCLYSRLVDWVVNYMNNKMAKNKAIFGEKYFVNILDYFGFEAFKRNDLQQLLINTFNEQMQYLYIQRVFAWETLELLEDEIQPPTMNYYNNKRGVDQLLGKPSGILGLVDEASKTGHNYKHILDSIEKMSTNPYVTIRNDKEFFFSHFTGKIIYDIRDMSQKNRDFLPPEMIETLRLSSNPIIREFFVNKLTKTGNLICNEIKEKNKWSSALVAETDKTKRAPEQQFSQTKHMRTVISTFRSVSLEILRDLAVGAGSGGTHFVRCIRTNLSSKPNTFHQELVKQQMRALSVVDSARARQLGFPHRITFPEFLRRYKFLAFDFDENVEVTQENCRLLLIRLKMEGWIIGKSKVFLKYYNEEYLSRLYETQVKKIVKIQAMMRAFLAKRNVATKLKNLRNKAGAKLVRQLTADISAEAAAALLIQKAYRGYNVRKKYGPLINKESGQIDKDTANFIKPFANKWKKKSMFQVLLQYRSAKFQDLINLSQQVHIFNQNVMHELQKCQEALDLEKVDPSANAESWLGDKKPSVWKVPFHFDEIPYFDTEHMCEGSGATEEDQETWDSPLKWRRNIINEMKSKDYNKSNTRCQTPNVQPHPNDQTLINTPYSRDPLNPVTDLPNLEKNIKISPAKSVAEKKIESPKHKVIGRIQTNANQVIISPKKIRVPQIDQNFEGANQDFEFIPNPNKLKKRPGNPIAELESIGRKNEKNEDEPPFNFQGMLRKTNFKRESLKKIQEEELPYNKVLKNKVNKQITSTELAPGIILEGIETEL